MNESNGLGWAAFGEVAVLAGGFFLGWVVCFAGVVFFEGVVFCLLILSPFFGLKFQEFLETFQENDETLQEFVEPFQENDETFQEFVEAFQEKVETFQEFVETFQEKGESFQEFVETLHLFYAKFG